MQPQFRQMPPGRSASDERPPLAQLGRPDQPRRSRPGPEPTTTALEALARHRGQTRSARGASRVALRSARKRAPMAPSMHPVVRRQRSPHALADGELAVDRDRLVDDRPDRRGSPLGRIDDRAELVDREHPEVRHREGRAGELLLAELARASARSGPAPPWRSGTSDFRSQSRRTGVMRPSVHGHGDARCGAARCRRIAVPVKLALTPGCF